MKKSQLFPLEIRHAANDSIVLTSFWLFTVAKIVPEWEVIGGLRMRKQPVLPSSPIHFIIIYAFKTIIGSWGENPGKCLPLHEDPSAAPWAHTKPPVMPISICRPSAGRRVGGNRQTSGAHCPVSLDNQWFWVHGRSCLKNKKERERRREGEKKKVDGERKQEDMPVLAYGLHTHMHVNL